MSDAKVAYGFDIRGKVRRRCRFGQNLPQTSLSVFNPKTLSLPVTRLKGIRQREQATDGKIRLQPVGRRSGNRHSASFRCRIHGRGFCRPTGYRRYVLRCDSLEVSGGSPSTVPTPIDTISIMYSFCCFFCYKGIYNPLSGNRFPESGSVLR